MPNFDKPHHRKARAQVAGDGDAQPLLGGGIVDENVDRKEGDVQLAEFYRCVAQTLGGIATFAGGFTLNSLVELKAAPTDMCSKYNCELLGGSFILLLAGVIFSATIALLAHPNMSDWSVLDILLMVISFLCAVVVIGGLAGLVFFASKLVGVDGLFTSFMVFIAVIGGFVIICWIFLLVRSCRSRFLDQPEWCPAYCKKDD